MLQCQKKSRRKGADQINMGRELGAGSFELLISATDVWAAPARCRTDQKESMISPEFYFTTAQQGFRFNSNNIVFNFVFFAKLDEFRLSILVNVPTTCVFIKQY
jgi:hypothetical protein